MTRLWWLPTSVAIIILSVLLTYYVESRIERRTLTGELIAIFMMLLWGALLAGICLERNVLAIP